MVSFFLSIVVRQRPRELNDAGQKAGSPGFTQEAKRRWAPIRARSSWCFLNVGNFRVWQASMIHAH